MSKHSPGPWYALRSIDGTEIQDAGAGLVAIALWTGTGDEAANARLIAAAPEMLTLLRHVAKRREGGAEEAEALIACIEGE